MQHAPEALGTPFARPLDVADIRYAADVDTRTGFCAPTLWISDIDGVDVFNAKNMGETSVCPVATGACVASTVGGAVEGWDMYGQVIVETVAAAGTSTIAFAGITLCPDDATWTNQFGLPYKYASDAAVPNTDVTITAPAADEDARGTFAFGGTFVDEDPFKSTSVEIPYVADRTALLGEPYATRWASDAPKSVAETVMAGTIDDTGAIAITVTEIADNSGTQTYTFPDGGTVQIDNAAGTLNYQLSPLWLSKYAKQIVDVDTLVFGATKNGNSIAVDFTGTVAFAMQNIALPSSGVLHPPVQVGGSPGGQGGKPQSATQPPPPAVPASFPSHAEADLWLEAFSAWAGRDLEPRGWMSMTLVDKRTAANDLYIATVNAVN